MNHTPGPWEIHEESEKPWKKDAREYGYFISPNNKLPMHTYIVHVFNYPGQTEGNAKLISKSPELLEHLKVIERAYSRHDITSIEAQTGQATHLNIDIPIKTAKAISRLMLDLC